MKSVDKTLPYSYTSNRRSTFGYDINSNVTNDATNSLQTSYNLLNFPAQTKSGTTVKANYSYLSDGMKASVLNASGVEYDYNGTFTYSHASGGTRTLESVAFGIALDDFGARRYDRTAWTSIDPLAEKYYSLSPYAYCAGNPVRFVDPKGDIVLFADGVSEEFKEKFAQAIEYMNECGTSYNIAALQKSERIYYVAEGEKNQYRGGENTIYWNPNIVSLNETTGIYRSPVTSLAHEFGHARNHEDAIINGSISTFIDNASQHSDEQYDTIEDRSVITRTEQYAARRHGEISASQVTRYDHTGKPNYYLDINGQRIYIKSETQKSISQYVKILNGSNN